jgi:hypothetical protein
MTTPDDATSPEGAIEQVFEDLKREVLKYFENNPLGDEHAQVDKGELFTQVVGRIQQMSDVSAQATDAHAALRQNSQTAQTAQTPQTPHKSASPHAAGSAHSQGHHAPSKAAAGSAHSPGQHAPASKAAAGHGDHPQVVDSIMKHEGATGKQDGRPEVYGFRKGINPGYEKVMAAREKYGEGSKEERAVVKQLMEEAAQQGGANYFTDPGMQAAVTSVTHMRGAGGAHVILNMMAGEEPPKNEGGSLHSGTVETLKQLTPEQFQELLYDTRLRYDKIFYANKPGENGKTWWETYKDGLVKRYKEEQQQFLAMSQGQ